LCSYRFHGKYVRMFAINHPEQVAGMVLKGLLLAAPA
jgi:hypothetical protein